MVAFVAGYTLSASTRVSRVSKLRSSESESGILRFVDLGAQNYWDIEVVIECITETESYTLVDWLVTNQKNSVSLVVSSKTYTGYIDPRVQIRNTPDSKNPNLWTVTFGFKGIKA
jgi:cellulase/cellobiase CelA1